MTKLQIDRNQWWEAKRHNLSMEEEQARHNLETETITREANAEVQRSNLAREENARAQTAIAAQQAAISQMSAEETARANLAREAENFRHNSTSEKIERIANRMNNSREWAKISISEQRTQVQNYADLVQSKKTEVEKLLKQAELEAGLPQAQAAKIRSDIQRTAQELQLDRDRFRAEQQWKERELTVAEKRQKSDAMLNDAKRYESYLKSFNSLASGIGKAIGEIAKAAVT